MHLLYNLISLLPVTESNINVVGNVFSFVANKYPTEWYWKTIKVSYLTYIYIAMHEYSYNKSVITT